jgi:hypothetical protein
MDRPEVKLLSAAQKVTWKVEQEDKNRKDFPLKCAQSNFTAEAGECSLVL